MNWVEPSQQPAEWVYDIPGLRAYGSESKMQERIDNIFVSLIRAIEKGWAGDAYDNAESLGHWGLAIMELKELAPQLNSCNGGVK